MGTDEEAEQPAERKLNSDTTKRKRRDHPLDQLDRVQASPKKRVCRNKIPDDLKEKEPKVRKKRKLPEFGDSKPVAQKPKKKSPQNTPKKQPAFVNPRMTKRKPKRRIPAPVQFYGRAPRKQVTGRKRKRVLGNVSATPKKKKPNKQPKK